VEAEEAKFSGRQNSEIYYCAVGNFTFPPPAAFGPPITLKVPGTRTFPGTVMRSLTRRRSFSMLPTIRDQPMPRGKMS